MCRVTVIPDSGCGHQIEEIVNKLNAEHPNNGLKLGDVVKDVTESKIESVLVDPARAFSPEAHIAAKDAEKKIQQLLN